MENSFRIGALRIDQIKRRFLEMYGTVPRIFEAPGRTNLIGEHTDYNDGFVMPAAIDFYTWVAIALREDRRVLMYSEQFKQSSEFDLDRADPGPTHHWSDYVRGVAIQVEASGSRLQGSNILIDSNIPIGSGLSSSAAIEVASGLAFIQSASGAKKLDRIELAKLAQRAENGTVGAHVGIMDQFASANGRAGHALLLDCRSLSFELLPVPSEVNLVICNTMVKHSISGGEYNVRRSQCEQGVKFLAERIPGVHALRDVSLEHLNKYSQEMPELIYRRCRHVVSENARVQAAAKSLKRHDLSEFGKLMYESHRSLKEDYEVSCPELDMMVDFSSRFPGTFGARMTGGGFGGCTINLVSKESVNEFREQISVLYQEATGICPEIYVSEAADGAQECFEVSNLAGEQCSI